MKMIKITTGNQISVHDFPDGSISEQTKLLCKYIGPEARFFKKARKLKYDNNRKNITGD